MEMNPAHRSKLHKGFIKQVIRQNKKPSIKYIQIMPVILSYDEEDGGGYKPLCKTVFNNKWNGMNFNNLCNMFQQVMPNWFGSHRLINKHGKYILSMRGKQCLKRKKTKKAQLLQEIQ